MALSSFAEGNGPSDACATKLSPPSLPTKTLGEQSVDGELDSCETATLVSSGLEPTPEYEEAPKRSEAQQLRVICAEAYETASQDYLASPSPESLQRLIFALAKTDPEDIDPISAEKALASVHTFLKSEDVRHTLLACQLVVRYDLKRAEAPTMYASSFPELCTIRFRQVSNREDLDPEYFALLAETVGLWNELAESEALEEHQGYHLIASALHWVFGPFKGSAAASNVRYRFMNLLVATYSRMPREGKYRAVHDLLSFMLRSEDATRDAVHLLLRLIAVTGSVPLSVWAEATSLRKRQLIEADAQARHKDAVALCQMISRRLIDFAYENNEKAMGRDLLLEFLGECTSALLSPHLPSSEVLLSSFIATLFTLSQIHRNRKYCVFSFSVLRALQETLVLFQSSETLGDVDAVSLASAIETPEQINYLASRQCTLPGQPYFDLHLALTRPRSALKSHHVSESEWLSFLSQWPISGYYEHICVQIRSLAERDDIPDTVQVEVFKVLEKIVAKNVSFFNPRWLDRLSYASASVCEALVPVVAAVFRASDAKPYEVLHKMGTRLAVPGVKPFKKRVISLLSSIANASGEANDIAWLYLLIALADPDLSVSHAASERATAMFFAALQEDKLDARLSEALLAARSKAGENAYLVQEGLRKLVNNISASKEGPRVRALVSKLLSNGDLELAALLVEADGTFMPLAKIPGVFDGATQSSSGQRAGLRMLHAALSARPRVILSQTTATTMFKTLLAKLRTATEAEMEHIGPILSELVTLGGPHVQQERAKKLELLLDASFAKLCDSAAVPSSSSSSSPGQMAVFCQLIMISACVRFWRHTQGLDKASKIVERLVEFGHKAEANSSLSQLLVRTVFSIAAKYRVLFANRKVDAYLSSLQQGSAEFDCFMQLLFQYNWHEPETEARGPASGIDALQSMIKGSSQSEEMLATSAMLQKYLAHILQQADRDHNVVALRIISKALDHYLIVVDRCLPLVVSLCFSAKLSVAQAALATYAKICSRWPSSVLTKLVPGLKRCSDASELRPGPFARVWQLAKSSQSQRNIKLLIEAVVASLRHDATDVYAKLLISGLMQTPLDPKDARLLKVGLMESVFSFSARNKAHEAPHIARMILVHVFEAWLTRRYGLTSAAHQAQRPAENDALEYIDIDVILQRFAGDRSLAKQTFEELLDEQYIYGSQEMDELVYGKAKAVQSSNEPLPKKRRTHETSL